MVFHWECVAQVDIFAPTALPTGSLVTHAQSFFSSVATVLKELKFVQEKSDTGPWDWLFKITFSCYSYVSNQIKAVPFGAGPLAPESTSSTTFGVGQRYF